MNKEILNINEAYIVLNEGLIVIDMNNNKFKLSNDLIIVKSDNASFRLSKKEFLELYKNSKFIVLDDESESIDTKKDEEYYAFKHK